MADAHDRRAEAERRAAPRRIDGARRRQAFQLQQREVDVVVGEHDLRAAHRLHESEIRREVVAADGLVEPEVVDGARHVARVEAVVGGEEERRGELVRVDQRAGAEVAPAVVDECDLRHGLLDLGDRGIERGVVGAAFRRHEAASPRLLQRRGGEVQHRADGHRARRGPHRAEKLDHLLRSFGPGRPRFRASARIERHRLHAAGAALHAQVELARHYAKLQLHAQAQGFLRGDAEARDEAARDRCPRERMRGLGHRAHRPGDDAAIRVDAREASLLQRGGERHRVGDRHAGRAERDHAGREALERARGHLHLRARRERQRRGDQAEDEGFGRRIQLLEHSVFKAPNTRRSICLVTLAPFTVYVMVPVLPFVNAKLMVPTCV